MEVIILIATLIFVAAFMFGLLCIAAMGKAKEPRNKVRFFVKAVRDDMYWLYIKDKKGNISFIGLDEDFNNLWGLNPDDFTDMKKGEIREVFINLED